MPALDASPTFFTIEVGLKEVAPTGVSPLVRSSMLRTRRFTGLPEIPPELARPPLNSGLDARDQIARMTQAALKCR